MRFIYDILTSIGPSVLFILMLYRSNWPVSSPVGTESCVLGGALMAITVLCLILGIDRRSLYDTYPNLEKIYVHIPNKHLF